MVVGVQYLEELVVDSIDYSYGSLDENEIFMGYMTPTMGYQGLCRDVVKGEF